MPFPDWADLRGHPGFPVHVTAAALACSPVQQRAGLTFRQPSGPGFLISPEKAALGPSSTGPEEGQDSPGKELLVSAGGTDWGLVSDDQASTALAVVFPDGTGIVFRGEDVWLDPLALELGKHHSTMVTSTVAPWARQ